VLSVAAVVVVIVLMIVINSPSHPSGSGPALISPSASGRPPATAPVTATARSTPVVTLPTSQPSATSAPRLPVTVLNNSRIHHLAARVAAQLRAAGWPVARVGNYTGRIAASTVYFGRGEEPSARSLAARFGQIKRVLPRFAGLPGNGLTLVVTRDWTG
jgi:hypothetical protein